ncbi:putative ABC transport system permease protein [Brevibacterium sp. Mu109]|uniref:ABC transporter permease n=1 Tax=Brevibacterium sp. Mu109 TaxID=1255669 RepID=UPI000C4D4215|nr:ABC transporter permease [Brevibacterium sp. Mu109]SMX75261.1 putative ABC transport system permease protein [Brevibacterium sp. Mu109]
MPVEYQQSYDLQRHDVLRIATGTEPVELEIAGFIRDAQMASSMSSATRFLVAPEDFSVLKTSGGNAPEIIVEYLLDDPAAANDLQRAYESAEGVPQNGQAVTYSMIRLFNALGDGMVAVALMFVSVVLIAIALLSLRFVIRGSLEDQVRPIGTMKALGIPSRTIVSLQLSKYSVMTIAACVIGGLLAIPLARLLTGGIQAHYAQAPAGLMTVLAPVLSLVLVYLLVIAICTGVLRAVRRIDVVGALVHGSTRSEAQAVRRARRRSAHVRRIGLAGFRGGRRALTRRLAVIDLQAEAGQWVLILLVLMLATLLGTLPLSLLNTFENPRFVTYMGAPQADVRVDLQHSDTVADDYRDVLADAEADPRLTDVRSFAMELYETPGAEGWQLLRIEVGDYSDGGIDYLQGDAPRPGQIALSMLNAEEHQAELGDEITIRPVGSAGAGSAGREETLRVSGIYQDVTSGGYTAKMADEVRPGAAAYVVYAESAGDADPAAAAEDYSRRYPGASAFAMEDCMRQTMSYLTDALRSAAILAVVFGLGVVALITALFVRLRMTRNRQSMGTLAALGFAPDQIGSQVRFQTLITVALGTVLGVVLTATGGEAMVGVLLSLSGLGIAEVSFLPNPWLVYLAVPLALIATGYLSAVVLTARLRRAPMALWINEE